MWSEYKHHTDTTFKFLLAIPPNMCLHVMVDVLLISILLKIVEFKTLALQPKSLRIEDSKFISLAMLRPIYIKTSVQYAPISVYTTISMVCNGREKEKMMELGVSTAGTSKELDDILQIYSKQPILCRQLKKKNLSIEQ